MKNKKNKLTIGKQRPDNLHFMWSDNGSKTQFHKMQVVLKLCAVALNVYNRKY